MAVSLFSDQAVLTTLILECASAINTSYKDQLSFSISVAVGSTIVSLLHTFFWRQINLEIVQQTALFVLPCVRSSACSPYVDPLIVLGSWWLSLGSLGNLWRCCLTLLSRSCYTSQVCVVIVVSSASNEWRIQQFKWWTMSWTTANPIGSRASSLSVRFRNSTL